MANDPNVRGLMPINSPQGNIKLGIYRANTALAIFRNQPVALNNSGQVAVAAVGDNTPLLGSAVGFLDLTRAGLPSGMTTLTQAANLPISTDAYVLVADDPNQLFLMEEDTGGTALTTSAIGNSVNWTYQATTGNATTGYSTALIDRDTVGTGTDGMLQILEVYDIKNQDGTDNLAGDFAKWVVRISDHQLGPTKLALAI